MTGACWGNRQGHVLDNEILIMRLKTLHGCIQWSARRETNSMLGKICLGILVLGVCGEVLVPSPAGAAEQYLAYSGLAASQRTGQVLYAENHVLRFQDGRLAERVVLYTCPDGTPFARKVATYEDPLAPSFSFEDVTNGVREGVKAGEQRRVFFRGIDQKPEKSIPLQASPGLVVDTGFDEFIRGNWYALMTAGPLPLQFLVPSRLGTMNFQVQHVRSGSEEGVPTEVFRLKVQGVVGWIAPSIDVSYSKSEHVLVRYEGMSDLRDRAGDNLRADIRFRARDRKPSDAGAADTAKSAPLVACR
jgi:hypothetical protein